MRPPTHSAVLVAWGNAWLAGHVSYDDALVAVTGGDVAHVVEALPGEVGSVSLGWALGRLRTSGVRALSLALPVPGDLTGVPGPSAFRTAALDAGQGVVTSVSDPSRTQSSSCHQVGLVPVVDRHGTRQDGVVTSVRWQAYPLDGVPGASVVAPTTVREAERALGAAVRDTTAQLTRLEVARWRDDVAAPLAALRTGTGEMLLPPGYPGTAARLLATAERLGVVLDLARGDDGAAVSSSAVTGRTAALRELERAVRQARLAAYNCFGQPGS